MIHKIKNKMKTKHYILAVILSFTMSAAIASGEGVIINSPTKDAAMVMDFKQLVPVFPMQATFDEQILPLIPEQMDLLPVVPTTASFDEASDLVDLVFQSSSLRPVVPLEAGFCNRTF